MEKVWSVELRSLYSLLFRKCHPGVLIAHWFLINYILSLNRKEFLIKVQTYSTRITNNQLILMLLQTLTQMLKLFPQWESEKLTIQLILFIWDYRTRSKSNETPNQTLQRAVLKVTLPSNSSRVPLSRSRTMDSNTFLDINIIQVPPLQLSLTVKKVNLSDPSLLREEVWDPRVIKLERVWRGVSRILDHLLV